MVGFVLHILKLNIIAAGMILLVKLMSVFLKGKFTAQWKYLVWLILSLSLVIPIQVPEEFSLFYLQVSNNQPLEASPSDSNTTGTILSNVNSGSKTDSNVSISEVPMTDNIAKPVIRFQIARKDFPVSPELVTTVFLILWITIAVIKLICEGIAYYISLNNLKRMSIPVYNPVTVRIYSSVFHQNGIKNPPRLMQNAGLSTPLLTGLTKTELYLPSVGYTAEELKLIFHHELSHYRHKDLWYKMLLRMCATVYWFNPFLLIMLKEAENDIENLCDTKVIRHCSNNDHKLYRRLLLRTVALQNNIPYITASLNDSTMVFKDRILYMINLKHMKRNILPGVLLAALLVVVNFSVAFSAVEDSSPAAVTDDTKAIPSAPDIQEPAKDNTSKPLSMIKSTAQSFPDTSIQEEQQTQVSETETGTESYSINSDTLDQAAETYMPETDSTDTDHYQEPAPTPIPYNGGFDSETGYINTVSDENGNIFALRDNGDGSYSDDNGNSYTYNGGTSWTDQNGTSYSTLDDRYHYEGMELDTHSLSGDDGNTVNIIQTTNGDYLYRDENGTGFTDNGDGTWTDEYGNTYSE